jgi:hypothetical protein
MRHFSSLVVVLLAVVLFVSRAEATYNPCAVQAQNAYRAERNLMIAQNRLEQAQYRFSSYQESVVSRQYAYQAQIEQARVNLNYAGSQFQGNGFLCVGNGFFNWGFARCLASVAIAKNRARAYAQAALNSAIVRYNTYVVYAQGALARQAMMVQTAQVNYDTAAANYQAAQNAYNQCTGSQGNS